MPATPCAFPGHDKVTSTQGFYNLPRREVFITLAGVMMAMFLGSLDQTVVSTAMPRIMADLGGFSHYTWVTTAYLVTSTIMMPVIGRLTDMYGRKGFYIAGIAIFLVGSVLSGLSQTLTQLIIFRAIQGIGGGIMMANAFIVIGDLFPPAERGKYQGMTTAVFGLSSVIGPTLGGFLTDNLSWHWIFYINIPLGIPIMLLFIRYFPHIRPAARKHQVDILGLMTLTVSVVTLMLGLTWAGVEYDWVSPQIIITLTIAAVMAVLFVIVESRAPEPIIPLALFRNRIFSLTMVIVFIAGFGMFGAIVFVPLYFQGVLGRSATSSGSFLVPMMLAMTVASLLSGQALSRLGGHYRIQGLIGMAIMATGVFLLSQMTVETPHTHAIFNIILVGLGIGTALPLLTIAVQNAVPYRVMGIATSSVQFFRSIGATLGLAVFGSVMASRFASELPARVPEAVKEALPPNTMSELTSNPQALVNPDAMAKLEEAFEPFGPQGAEMMQQLMHGLREALAISLTAVFLIGVVAVALGFIATIFLKELPLQKRYQIEEEGEVVTAGSPAQKVAPAQADPESADCQQQDKAHSSSQQDAKPSS